MIVPVASGKNTRRLANAETRRHGSRRFQTCASAGTKAPELVRRESGRAARRTNRTAPHAMVGGQCRCSALDLQGFKGHADRVLDDRQPAASFIVRFSVRAQRALSKASCYGEVKADPCSLSRIFGWLYDSKAFGAGIAATGLDRQAAKIQTRIARIHRFNARGTAKIVGGA